MFLENHHIKNDWDKFEDYCLRRVPGLPTGFKSIDDLIIGLPGVATVVGEPKCCKSTLALAIALHSAKAGHPVIFVDKENGLQRTRKRILCAVGNLTNGAVDSHNFTGKEQSKYDCAVRQVQSMPFYYFSDVKAEELDDAIKEAIESHGKRCLVVADSLQSLVADFNDRRSSVDHWVYLFNDLKIKYENQLTILMVSEKKRDSYGFASKSGGKESGAIEYKSEMVLDMYVTKEHPDQIHVDCVYNRDGDTGYICALHKSNPYTYNLMDVQGEVPA